MALVFIVPHTGDLCIESCRCGIGVAFPHTVDLFIESCRCGIGVATCFSSLVDVGAGMASKLVWQLSFLHILKSTTVCSSSSCSSLIKFGKKNNCCSLLYFDHGFFFFFFKKKLTELTSTMHGQ